MGFLPYLYHLSRLILRILSLIRLRAPSKKSISCLISYCRKCHFSITVCFSYYRRPICLMENNHLLRSRWNRFCSLRRCQWLILFIIRICKRCETCGSLFHIVNPYFAGFRKSSFTKTWTTANCSCQHHNHHFPAIMSNLNYSIPHFKTPFLSCKYSQSSFSPTTYTVSSFHFSTVATHFSYIYCIYIIIIQS